MKILIAEDDVTSRAMLAAVLGKNGYEVIETCNGSEALAELSRQDPPLLAILDWIMPVMDGVDVVRKIREVKTDRPPYIIMLTNRGEKTDIIAGLESGANDYLSKPFDPGELKARIEVGRRMVELQGLLAAKIRELTQAMEHIKTLQGILPICAYCKKIRDDDGYWNQVERYVSQHSQAVFSHGICPDCYRKMFPDVAENDEIHG